ncbi:hypothetical protein ILYODFUR_028566 [Ilyodon furcidens]|uniref:Uncharacterized protein n=1 Tax=Ilyodon furcidens TaxID=33524 RepID=A0ABV0VJG5_9TELE
MQFILKIPEMFVPHLSCCIHGCGSQQLFIKESVRSVKDPKKGQEDNIKTETRGFRLWCLPEQLLKPELRPSHLFYLPTPLLKPSSIVQTLEDDLVIQLDILKCQTNIE